MKRVGIICECNPLHSGHRYLIERARVAGADTVICVMSGCFVQRGEAAIAEPYARARAVVGSGADLVLELPFPYASASAELFASAGVEILSRFGVEELWFGSECGDIKPLAFAADIVSSADFAARYAAKNNEHTGTAKAFFELLQEACGQDVTFLSNDILGISYLCALRKRRSGIRPVTVKREGSGYLDQAVKENGHPSATALRRLLLEGGLDAAEPYLLPETANALQQAIQDGMAPASWRYAERAVLAYLRLANAEALSAIAELGGGLGNRLIDCAKQATSFDDLLILASTKKYTASRLQRGILFAMTGVTLDDLKTPPSYVRVLASNARGCECLAEERRSNTIPVVTRVAELPTDPVAVRQEMLHRRALSLYTLCLKNAADAAVLLRKNPLILK